ncbi:ATP-binding protein [Halobacillus sp. MO56]
MNSNALILSAMNDLIKIKMGKGAYGLVILGLPELPLKELLSSLNNPENTYVSLIGLTNEESGIRTWANNNGWDEGKVGFSSTHAVDVRNEAPDNAAKLAFVWEEEDRLHSLIERGYQYIGPTEITKQICELGVRNAENEPQKNLWRALGSETVAGFITLDGIIKYYLSLFPSLEGQNSQGVGIEAINKPRKNLVLLSLLPDNELLTGKYIDTKPIINRLVSNAGMVEQIQRADEEDRQDALKTIKLNSEDLEMKTKLQKSYNAYLRLTRSDYSALSDMELKDAYILLSGKKLSNSNNENGESPLPGGDVGLPGGGEESPGGGEGFPGGGEESPGGGEGFPGGGEESPGGGEGFPGGGEESPGGDEDFRGGSTTGGAGRPSKRIESFDDLPTAAVKLISEGERTVLKELVSQAIELIRAGKFDKNLLSVNHERLIIQVYFNPNEIAVSINGNFTSNGRMGGKVQAEDTDLEVIIDNFGRFKDKSEFLDDVRIRTLLEFMTKAKQLIPDFDGDNLLSHYIEARSKLLNYSDLLSTAPLACLLSNEETRKFAVESIKAYEALLEHLDEHYPKLHRESPEGAEYIYKEILEIDTIKIHSNDDISILLTSLNPLVIWKYVEISELVLKEDESLQSDDTELLSQELRNLPEPLLAVYAPGNSEQFEKLGFSMRIGSLPLYRSISVEISDLSQKSIETAAIKLGSLYFPIKENLRLLIVDPISTAQASRAIRKLINNNEFKKATLIVAKTGKRKEGTELPFDPVLKELAFENKVDIEVLRIKNSDQLHKYLSKKPVHLIGISGEKTKNVSLIESEGTKLHPLSVPHKIHPDPLMGTITLKPRSLKSSENGINHPFSIYHKIVSEVTGNYHSEFSMQEARKAPLEEINSLLPFSQFLITIGQIPEVMGATDLLRLTQNVDIAGDTVYTSHKDSIISRLSKHLRKFNYRPTQDGIMTLLRRLQVVGGEGIFSTITEKGENGLSETGVKGFLGLAVALNWYVNHSLDERSVVISLDSYLAKRWLNKRKDNKRSDFLGIRQLNDGSYSIDILEVKSYESTTDADVLNSHAADQLRSIARLIDNMVKNQGDLFTDRRRELLRVQIYREALQLETNHDAQWIRALNSIIDGSKKVSINLILLEVAFDKNINMTDEIFTPDIEVENQEELGSTSIRRVRFGEEDIQKYLEDYVEKVPETTAENTSTEENNAEVEDDFSNEEEYYNDDIEVDHQDHQDHQDHLGSSDEDNTKSDIKNTPELIPDNEEGKMKSEVKFLLGKQVGWDKQVFWDHRRNIPNPLANHNIVITGDPGKGKTQTIKGLIHEIRTNNIPLLIFDFKDDYIDYDFLENESVQKFDVMAEGLPFNPLTPSIDPIEKKFTALSHIVQLVAIIKRVYGLGPQQATSLRNAIVEAFKRKGIQPNVPTKESAVSGFPTFQEVEEILYEDERKNATLIGRLDLLFQIGIFPDKPKIDFDQLMKGSYSLRLSTLPDPDNEIKAAVAEIIILALHNYLISKEHPRKLTRAIVLDEAHRVSKSSALLGLMREGRAFGVGMLIATQFPTDIPQDIYGCTETKLFLGNDDYSHAEASAKKLEGSSSRSNVTALADQIRSMQQFRAVLRNSQNPNVFVDLLPYYKR